MKKLDDFDIFLFDMDGTLAQSKSPISERMKTCLEGILSYKKIGIISGGNWEQFETQVVEHINQKYYHNLIILPTSGTQLYIYDVEKESWVQKYNEAFKKEERAFIISQLDKAVRAAGYAHEEIHGIRFEDRNSQVTYSALGSRAPYEKKKLWDPNQQKRKTIISLLPQSIKDTYTITIGGTTSIDITQKGIDKSYAIKKIHTLFEIPYENMVFFGDKLQEGGNDYPVKKVLTSYIEVVNENETEHILSQYLKTKKV
jgi:HAD superfamily hydrolase (TIGR01484 family)